ncbi:MAG: AbrB/MazE/SpoVT family DNA-binding domain-containing protein [Ruminococcus sp.]|nr:AbrB/MazE/SpoVT family DNA-binding domain-containing protein [Ruminococcus sp.]
MKKGKYVGISKVGEKGQIVIPKEAREMFDIKPGDSLIILCDINQGMAIVKSDIIESIGDEIFKAKQQEKEEE